MKLLLIGFLAFSLIGILESHEEELYLDADFDFFDDKLKESRTFSLGDTVTIVGHSSFYKETTDEHFPAPDSVFHVTIKNPKGQLILEDDYISDVDGKIEFSIPISKDYPVGEYAVEMIVDKRKNLDLSFFVGHLPGDVVKTNDKFDLWMEDSEIVSLSNTNLMGVLCSDYLKQENDRESVFLDPSNDDILENHSVNVRAYFTDPNGNKFSTSSNPEKDSCTPFNIRTPDSEVSGEWFVYVTALWINDETLYEATSHSVSFQLKDPIFRGVIEKILIDKPWNQITPLDWSPDGKSILLTYYLLKDENSLFPQLATMSVDGNDIATLDIPMLLNIDEQIHLAKFSPDGKFIHFIAGKGNLFRYDLKTSETLQLIHQENGIIYFDYYNYFEEEPDKYSIVVSVNGESYFDDSSKNDFVLLDIGTGEDQKDVDNAHILVNSLETADFDISPDGKKILFKKTIDSDYGWANRILAYVPAQGDIVEIPNNQVNCGSTPKWSPSGDMIVYHVHSCSRGAPGGILYLISVDGSYHEVIRPYTNYDPWSFVISPDGSLILYSAGSEFEIMTLAKPIPEFEAIAMMILIFSIIPMILFSKLKKYSFISMHK